MGAFIAYTIKGAVLLCVMFSIYMLTMSRLKCVSLRRMSLIAIYILSLFLPIVSFHDIPVFYGEGNVDAVQPVSLEATVVQSHVSAGMAYDILSVVILAGISVSVVSFVSSMFYAMRYMWKGRTMDIDGMMVTVVDGSHPSPFCFCGRIFVSEEECGDISAMALAHENSHIRHRHFLDLLLARVVGILQWWNPFALLMTRELREVHEFQADGDVLEAGYDRKEYQYLLLSKAGGTDMFSLWSGLRHSRLKNRLLMMNRVGPAGWKRMAAVMIVPGAMAGWMVMSSPALATMIGSFGDVDVPFYHNGKVNAISVEQDEERTVDLNSIPQGDKPGVTINGVVMDYDIVFSHLDLSRIKSVSVYKDSIKYPNGLIAIELLSDKEYKAKVEADAGDGKVSSHGNTSEIKVLVHGVERK